MAAVQRMIAAHEPVRSSDPAIVAKHGNDDVERGRKRDEHSENAKRHVQQPLQGPRPRQGTRAAWRIWRFGRGRP